MNVLSCLNHSTLVCHKLKFDSYNLLIAFPFILPVLLSNVWSWHAPPILRTDFVHADLLLCVPIAIHAMCIYIECVNNRYEK